VVLRSPRYRIGVDSVATDNGRHWPFRGTSMGDPAYLRNSWMTAVQPIRTKLQALVAHRFLRGVVAALGLVALVAASSPEPGRNLPPGRLGVIVGRAQDTANAFQAEILIDGRVDFEEYRAAIDATLKCARDKGVPVVGPTLSADGYLEYAYGFEDDAGNVAPDAVLLGDLNGCWVSFSRLIEEVWDAQRDELT
jgi:hypothetical protein